MGRIDFKDNGEEHNPYQSYTDLMSGFLIVFIIASVTSIARITDTGDKGEDGNVTEKLRAAIYELKDAQKEISNKDLEYDTLYNVLRLKKDINFKAEKYDIPDEDKVYLVNVGKSIEKIADRFKNNKHIGLKIIIDGRIEAGKIERQRGNQYRLSYNRALSLFYLWADHDIVHLSYDDKPQPKSSALTDKNVIIAGSGKGGEARIEGKNKTFIIRLVPYVKTDLTNENTRSKNIYKRPWWQRLFGAFRNR